jgi:hypothetical protein
MCCVACWRSRHHELCGIAHSRHQALCGNWRSRHWALCGMLAAASQATAVAFFAACCKRIYQLSWLLRRGLPVDLCGFGAFVEWLICPAKWEGSLP